MFLQTRQTTKIVRHRYMMRTIRDAAKNTVNPVLGKHSATVVIMHGLGDTAEGYR